VGKIMQHHFNKEEGAVQLFLELLRSKRVRGYGPRTGRQPHESPGSANPIGRSIRPMGLGVRAKAS
jgi:predicted DNA-binding WGR domain protein